MYTQQLILRNKKGFTDKCRNGSKDKGGEMFLSFLNPVFKISFFTFTMNLYIHVG